MEGSTLRAAAELLGSRFEVRPLTHRYESGEPYVREAVVEAQIRECLLLTSDQLGARAVSSPTAAEFVREETLVFFCRGAHSLGDGVLVDAVLTVLLARSAALIRKHVGSLGPDAVEEGAAEFAIRLVQALFDDTRGQYWELRFWDAAKKLAIRVFQHLLRQQRHAGDTVPLSSIAGYDRDDDDSRGVRVSDAHHPSSESAEARVVTIDQVRTALQLLDGRIREAFLLRHFYGWPIESLDESVQTISRQFGVDPRTIRNWLRRADDILAPMRTEGTV